MSNLNSVIDTSLRLRSILSKYELVTQHDHDIHKNVWKVLNNKSILSDDIDRLLYILGRVSFISFIPFLFWAIFLSDFDLSTFFHGTEGHSCRKSGLFVVFSILSTISVVVILACELYPFNFNKINKKN